MYFIWQEQTLIINGEASNLSNLDGVKSEEKSPLPQAPLSWGGAMRHENGCWAVTVLLSYGADRVRTPPEPVVLDVTKDGPAKLPADVGLHMVDQFCAA